jgi:hypothetical protein
MVNGYFSCVVRVRVRCVRCWYALCALCAASAVASGECSASDIRGTERPARCNDTTSTKFSVEKQRSAAPGK